MVTLRLASLLPVMRSWFSQAQPHNAQAELDKPPAAMMTQLMQDLAELPIPAAYRTVIQETVQETVQDWRQHPDVGNSLVFLGSPVQAIAPILRESLQGPITTDEGNLDMQFPLADYDRPADPLAIPAHLHNALEPSPEATNGVSATPPSRCTVVVIPDLEQYFLRCIQGWEGIEYLQQLIIQDPSRFWVLGCSYWAWAFLDRVCEINAYLERVVPLPELTGEDLRAWLRPVAASVAAPKDLDDPDSALDLGNNGYWSALASVSGGVSSIAAQLWGQSLRVRSEALPDDETEAKTAAAAPTPPLTPTPPLLPTLMPLAVMDRYLLHSLLLHRQMTRSHLALSLGEAEQTIRPRVQVLSREGIIQSQCGYLKVHPAHYPRLYGELGNNNFLIGEA